MSDDLWNEYTNAVMDIINRMEAMNEHKETEK
jgi:hypothetical protein